MRKSTATTVLFLVLSCIFPPTLSAQSILQKILDETNDGDTLYIEKNDYISDNSVTLTGRKYLTLIFEEGTTVTCSSQFQDIFVIQNCTGIHLYNGTFKHQISEETKSFGSGFYLFQSQNIKIYNADLENNGVTGLFVQSVSNLELSKCLIHNNSASAFLFQEQNRNIVLKGNKYENNGTDGDEIYTFKKNETETDPFESIEERALSEWESVRMDSLFNVQKSMFPQIRKAFQNPEIFKAEYDSLNKQSLDASTIETHVFPAWLEKSEQSGNVVVWLNLPDIVCRYLCNASGLAKFDTRDANAFFKYDEPDFTNMTPKAFLKGIQNSVVYVNENLPSGIHWNCDPVLDQMVQELKTKSIQQIADAQETVVYKLLQVWEKYQSAGLLFEKFRFVLTGNCHFLRSDYKAETEIMDAAFSLDNYYLATMRLPLSTSEFKQLFFYRDNFTVYFTMQVHPGFKQQLFNSGIKNQLTWTLPNLEPIENPTIHCMNQKGIAFKFNVYGMLSQIWPDGFASMNRNNSYPLLGGMWPLNSTKPANIKISQAKNTPLLKSGEVVNRILKSMEYYSQSMGDCYFGFSNNGQKIMDCLFPIEQKEKQYLVYNLESQSEAEVVIKALTTKGMHFAETYSQGQVIFCYTRHLK